MSQIYKQVTTGGLPPQVPTSFETDDGTAVPDNNILIIHADDSREDNNNGIIAKGGTPATPAANEVDIIITNRLTNAAVVTTVGAVTTPIITFTPILTGTYTLECRIAAFNTTSTLGAGYSIFQAIRFDSTGLGTATLCGFIERIVNEEGTMANANITTTTVGPDLFINAVGYVDGITPQTINWNAVALYTFVGA